FDPGPYRKSMLSGYGTLFGPRFTYSVQPTRSVVGTVRDRIRARPLGGVDVRGQDLNIVAETRTGPDGHYRLTGLAPAARIWLYASAAGPGATHLGTRHVVNVSPGLEPVTA